MLFFSIPLLISFAIPIFVDLPTFPTIGAMYLRFNSLPDITQMDIAIMLISYIVSMCLVSFAIVDINLLIKSERTMLNIKKEFLKGVTRYTLNVFWLFLTLTILLFIIQLVTQSLGFNEWLGPILALIVSIPFFYAPAGLVIDDLSPGRALTKSTKQVLGNIPLFILWILIGVIMLSILDVIFLSLNLGGVGSFMVIILNSLIVMPFLIVLQTQMYLKKYSIIS